MQKDDVIYRQAAIDKLDPLFESLAIDKIKALPTAQPNLQPTCNNLATDVISRRAAIDVLDKRFDKIPMEQTNECNNCKHISDDVMTGNRCYKCIFDKIDGWEAKDEDNGS